MDGTGCEPLGRPRIFLVYSSMIKSSLTLLAAFAPALFAWEYDTPYPMPTSHRMGEAGRSDTAWYFDTVATLGRYARTSSIVHEGGWSGLERDTTDPTGHTFWTVSEGGLAVSRESAGRNDRLIAFPGHHQKLARVVLAGGAISIARMDSIATWGDKSLYTTGLRNTASSSDVVTLRMDLSTGGSVAGDTLAASPGGYDMESVRSHGGSFWISDESVPAILKVNATTMRIDKQWLPDNGLPKVYARIRSNRGFEAMATTPSGKVVAIVQSPLYNAQGSADNSSTRDSRVTRMVVLDPTTGAVREHVVLNDQKPNALGPTRKGRDTKMGDLVALDENRFVVVEHGEGAQGKYWVDLWELDIAGATDVTASNKLGMTFSGGTLTLEQLSDSATLSVNGISPVAKRLLRGDLVGTTPWRSRQPEGLAVVDDSTVALLSDDNHGCREMDSAGAVDGICHIGASDASRSSLLYLKVPSMGIGRTSATRTSRRGLSVRAVPGGVAVRWSGATDAFRVDLRDPSGRSLGGGAVAAAGTPGSRTFSVGSFRGVGVVRISGDGREMSVLVAHLP